MYTERLCPVYLFTFSISTVQIRCLPFVSKASTSFWIFFFFLNADRDTGKGLALDEVEDDCGLLAKVLASG